MVPFGFYLFYGSAVECIGMSRKSQIGSITGPALVGTAGVMLAATVPVYWALSGEPYPLDCALGALGWPLAATPVALVGCFVWYLPTYQTGNSHFQRALLAGWVSVYFGTTFAFAIALRLTGEPHWGLFLLVGVILITKFSDVGAYFAGRAIGRNKLCPQVSPGKTVEGLVGGIVLAILGGSIYFGVFGPYAFGSQRVEVSVVGIVFLGISLSLAGVVGDLLESVFKRELGCKDSGSLLPGLGGLWDVTDSLLPAMVVGYLSVAAELIQGPGQ